MRFVRMLLVVLFVFLTAGFVVAIPPEIEYAPGKEPTGGKTQLTAEGIYIPGPGSQADLLSITILVFGIDGERKYKEYVLEEKKKEIDPKAKTWKVTVTGLDPGMYRVQMSYYSRDMVGDVQRRNAKDTPAVQVVP